MTERHPRHSSTNGETRPRVAVCVGTYRRNDLLRVMLEAARVAAEQARDVAAVGMVVIDDNPDGAAEVVVDDYADAFELGVRYRQLGRGNISLVRNAMIDVALEFADWIAMTDDDCEPRPDWIVELVSAQQRWKVDCVTGPMEQVPAAGHPAWLVDQPFLSEGAGTFIDGQEMTHAMTTNSLISVAWLHAHPDQRFVPELGVVGGEDMVFFRSAHRRGMSIRFAERTRVRSNETPNRCTFRYRMKVSYWLGNTEAVTNLWLQDASRRRLLLRAIRRAVVAVARPVRQVAGRRPPQFRFALAMLLKAIGLAVGVTGFAARHH